MDGEDPEIAAEMAAEPPPSGGVASLDGVLGGAPAATDADVRDLIAPTGGGAPADPAAVASITGGPEVGPPAPDAVIDPMLAKLDPARAATPGAAPVGQDKAAAAEDVKPEDVIGRQKELDLQAAEDARREAEARHVAAIDHQADVQDALDKGNELLGKRQSAYDQALASYQNMKLPDYWEGHSKARARLALAFGALGAMHSGAAGGSTENHVLTQLNHQIDEYHQQQKQQIERARDSVVMARTGIADAKEAKAALLEDANAKKVAALGTLEADAREHLALRGVPQAQIDADQRVLALQEARRKAALAADEQRRKDAESLARQHYLEARASKAARAAGSGGGGGGGMKPGAIAEFKKAIVDGADDGKGGTRPLNAAEIQAKADALGIPAVAKAGRPSVENLTKDVAFVAGQKAKADAAAEKRSDKFDADLQKELYPASGKGPGTQLERIEAMRSELKDAIANGDKTAATRVLEEAGGMLSGGKSTKNTVHLLEELKSSSDKLSSAWGRITGNPGDTKEFTQRLDKLLDGAAGEKRAEIDAIRKRYDERRAKSSGGGGAAPAPGAGGAPAKAGLSKENEAYLRGIYDNPNASPADRAKAGLALRNFGVL